MNQKQGKGAPKPQNKGEIQGMASQDNLPNPQAKNNTVKLKKDSRKWCEFHKSSTDNTIVWWARKSLAVEMKASKSD